MAQDQHLRSVEIWKLPSLDTVKDPCDKFSDTEGDCGDFSSLKYQGRGPCSAGFLPWNTLTFSTCFLLPHSPFQDPGGQTALGVTEREKKWIEKGERKKEKKKRSLSALSVS